MEYSCVTTFGLSCRAVWVPSIEDVAEEFTEEEANDMQEDRAALAVLPRPQEKDKGGKTAVWLVKFTSDKFPVGSLVYLLGQETDFFVNEAEIIISCALKEKPIEVELKCNEEGDLHDAKVISLDS